MKYLLILVFIIYSGCSQKDNTIVTEFGKEGILNSDGEYSVKPIYDRVYPFDEYGYAKVQKDGLYGLVDSDSKLVIPVKYESIDPILDGYLKISQDKKFGLVDKNKNIIIKPIYESIYEISDDSFAVKLNNKYGCIVKDDRTLSVKIIYNSLFQSIEKRARFEIDGKWGYLDDECNVLIKPIYEYVADFQKGYAKVKMNNKWGYLDNDGKLISKPIFDNGNKF